MKLSRRWLVYASMSRTLVIPATGEIARNPGLFESHPPLFAGRAWVLQPVLKAIMGAALAVLVLGIVWLVMGEGLILLAGYVFVQLAGIVLIWPKIALPFLLHWIGYRYCSDVYAPDHVRALEAVR